MCNNMFCTQLTQGYKDTKHTGICIEEQLIFGYTQCVQAQLQLQIMNAPD